MFRALITSSRQGKPTMIGNTLKILGICLILAVGSGWDATQALAGTVTSRGVRLMKTPGESSRVVARVGKGAAVTILSKRGRWVKIRANGRTGWVTRTSLSSGDTKKVKPRTKRKKPFVRGRSTSRTKKKTSAPKDRVAGDAVRDDEFDDEFDDDEDAFDDDVEIKKHKRKRSVAKSKSARNTDDDEDDEEYEEFSEEDDIPDVLKTPQQRERARQRARQKQRSKAQKLADKKAEKREQAQRRERARARAKKRRGRPMYASVDARIYSKPKRRARTVDDVDEGSRVYVLKQSRSGQWLYVANERGDKGWIRSKYVVQRTDYYGKFGLRVGARLGATSQNSVFASNGSGTLLNYSIGSLAATGGVEVDMTYRVKPTAVASFDVSYLAGVSTPGIRVPDNSGGSVDTGYKTHDLSLGLSYGHIFNKRNGLAFFGRLGFYSNRFVVSNIASETANPARLPSEVLSGPTLGFRLVAPAISDTVGLRFGADAMGPLTKRTQTAGLEDGTSHTVNGFLGHAELEYKFHPRWAAHGRYRFGYSKTVWSGAAQTNRPQQATEAARKDTSHLVAFGLGTWF